MGTSHLFDLTPAMGLLSNFSVLILVANAAKEMKNSKRQLSATTKLKFSTIFVIMT